MNNGKDCVEIKNAEDAWRTLGNNRCGYWPVRNKVRENSNRLEPFPSIAIQLPKIEQSTKIMTLGSCFANNLLKFLSFYNVDSINKEYLLQCENGDMQWTNIYNPKVFSRFVKMALDILNNGELSSENQQLGVVALGDEWIDLMFTIEREDKSPSLDELVQRRTKYFKKFLSRIFEADVICCTFGLAECWFDKEYQTFINVTPSKRIVKRYPDRFEFRVLDHAQAISAMEEIVHLVNESSSTNPKFVFTVSPVPLLATFRNQDVIVSNFYSKSLLRSSIEPIVHNHENVFYFPSFEMLLHTNGTNIWTNDLRHIYSNFITAVINNFVQHSLCPKDFPNSFSYAYLLKLIVQLLSKTEDTPESLVREVGVGFYSLYPSQLSPSAIEDLERFISKFAPTSDTKSHLILRLIHAMNTRNKELATALYKRILSLFVFSTSYEVALLAGYGLLLKQPDLVISVLEVFKNERHEYWQMYQHYFLAYHQKGDFETALQYAKDCFEDQGVFQWLWIDHRAKTFVKQILAVAKKQQNTEVSSICIDISMRAMWS